MKNQIINPKHYFLLPIAVILILIGTACGKLTQANSTSSNIQLTLSATNTVIDVNDFVTINAAVQQTTSTSYQIQWTTDKGQLNKSTGNTVVLTPANQTGTINICATLITESTMISKNIQISAIYSDQTLPITPKKLTATPSDNSLILTWEPGQPENIGGYNLYYSTDPTRFEAAKNLGNVLSYTLTGLTNNMTYYVAVSAYDSTSKKNESPLSAKISAVPFDSVNPGKPLNMSIKINDDNSLTITWTNPSDSDFKGITLRRSTINFPSKDDGTELYNGTGQTFTDTSVQTGIEYFYSIYAYDEVPLYSDPAQKSITIITNWQPAKTKKN